MSLPRCTASTARSAAMLLMAATLWSATVQAVWGWDVGCITEPVGFGRGTVGGVGGEVVVPRNLAELKNYLKDDVPRVVLLNQTFDFVGSEGEVTRDGCFFQKCGDGFQYSLIVSDTCVGREPTQVTLDKAGLTPLNVGSFKTIAGVDGRGAIRGKGLKIRQARQVIIRDLRIVDVNPAVIWGGDALAFNGVDQAWIHNVTFKNIGRQFLVTYQASNTGITVSSCTFDGATPNSPYCDGMHYWVWLFWGTDDRITLVNNRVPNTGGRLPHAGGWDRARSFVHVIGNVFDTNSHVALEPFQGSYLLVEGNRYCGMRSLVGGCNGSLFLVNTEAEAGQCAVHLGQPCLLNRHGGGTEAVTRSDDVVLGLARGLERGPEAVNDAREALARCVPLTGCSKKKVHRKNMTPRHS